LAEPLKWGGSSDFVSFARATALIKLPKDSRMSEGSIVKVATLVN
jgi:molybdopterin biosynthesis enzyme